MQRHPRENGDDVRRGVLLAAATLSQFSGSVAQQGTVVLGVFFASAYGLTLAQMGGVVSSLVLGLVVSALIVGALVDRYGSRRVLFCGTLILVAASTALGIFQNLGLSVALLFLLGLALSTVSLAGVKSVLTTWPRERRGLPMGIRQMGVPAGAMAAALALPALATRFGLHAIYFGFAVLLALGGFAFCAVLPSGNKGDTTVSLDGHVRLRYEAHRLLVPCASGFLLGWGQYAVSTYTIPFLSTHNGIAIGVAGVLLAVAQAGGAGARILLGHLSDRLGARRDLVLMATSACGGLLAVGLAMLPRSVALIALVPLWFVLGALLVGWNALMLTWAGERVSVGNAGAAMGLATSAILLGATICPPVFGFVVQVSGSFSAAWLMLGGILAVAAGILWVHARWEAGRAGAPQTEPAAVAR